MAGNQPETPGYTAFISYSREDEAFAKQLETEIEAHQRPASTGGARVFRDRSDFTGSAYESALDGHLRNSRTLIVLCSPHARRSDFVGDEIRRFARHHGTERIFPILVSGLPDNEADDKKAFPPALLEVMQGSGIPLGAEYRGLDLTKERVNAGRFEGEWHKLLANIYGVTPAEIRDEDTKRQVRLQQQKTWRYAGIAALSLILAVALGVLSWRAYDAERRARAAEDRANAMTAKVTTELALEQKAHVEPTPGGSVAADAELPARVYVHVRNDQQMEMAKRLAPVLTEELNRAGLRVLVPPIQRLDVGPTKSSELRYFRDNERDDAERIAAALRGRGVNDLVVKKVPGYESSQKIRPRHFEVWLKPPGTAP